MIASVTALWSTTITAKSIAAPISSLAYSLSSFAAPATLRCSRTYEALTFWFLRYLRMMSRRDFSFLAEMTRRCCQQNEPIKIPDGCAYFPRSHGGEGMQVVSHPRTACYRPSAKVPNLRIDVRNVRPEYAKHVDSVLWESCPERFRPASSYNNQDKVVRAIMYTVGDRIWFGLRRQGIICSPKESAQETETKMSGISWLIGGPIRNGWREVFRMLQFRAKKHDSNTQGKKFIPLLSNLFANIVLAISPESHYGRTLIETWREAAREAGDWGVLRTKKPEEYHARSARVGSYRRGGQLPAEAAVLSDYPDAISVMELDRLRYAVALTELAPRQAGEDNDVREDNQQSGGDYSEDEEGDNEEVRLDESR
ncbi:hypothetical protein Tco_0444643 [Tanacetum coccineum]